MGQKNNNKHRKIISAATKVFAKNGFYKAKVSEIAKKAGIADGTIYIYFKHK
ncbi:MAG: helix-turn-helix transcriptional regulator, partial [Deltaproteobacteria bacterium]|nr:helix-turn-helix transcriptional regulator [Deltaproteobacteria bacterium]